MLFTVSEQLYYFNDHLLMTLLKEQLMIVKSSTQMSTIDNAVMVPGNKKVDSETRYFNFTGHELRLLEGTGHQITIPPRPATKTSTELGMDDCFVIIKVYPQATHGANYDDFDLEFIPTVNSHRVATTRHHSLDGYWLTTTIIPYSRIEESVPASYYDGMHNVSIGAGDAGTRRFEHPMLRNIDNGTDYKSSAFAVAVEVFLPEEKERKYYINLNGTIVPVISSRSNASAKGEVKISHWSNTRGEYIHGWYMLEDIRREGGISGIRLYETKDEAVSDKDHPRYKDMEKLESRLDAAQKEYEQSMKKMQAEWTEELDHGVAGIAGELVAHMRANYHSMLQDAEDTIQRQKKVIETSRELTDKEIERLKVDLIKERENNLAIRTKQLKDKTTNVGIVGKAVSAVVDVLRWGLSTLSWIF